MLVVRCLAHMAAADWTTGAVDGRRLVLHTCGKMSETGARHVPRLHWRIYV